MAPLYSCATLNDHVTRQPTRHTDSRPQQPEDKWVPLADNFEFTSDTQPHRHKPLHRPLRGFDALDNGPRPDGSSLKRHLPQVASVAGSGGVTDSVVIDASMVGLHTILAELKVAQELFNLLGNQAVEFVNDFGVTLVERGFHGWLTV